MKGERMESNCRPEGKADGEIRKVVSALWKRRNFHLCAPIFGNLSEFHLKRRTGTDMQDILPARLSLYLLTSPSAAPLPCMRKTSIT